MSVPTLIIFFVAVSVVVSAIRALLPAVRSRASAPLPEVPLTPDLQSRLRTLAAQGQKGQAVRELREVTGLGRRDATSTVAAIAAGGVRPVPAPARGDLPRRARVLAVAGRHDEAVRLVRAETGMSGPEATTFVRALLGWNGGASGFG